MTTSFILVKRFQLMKYSKTVIQHNISSEIQTSVLFHFQHVQNRMVQIYCLMCLQPIDVFSADPFIRFFSTDRFVLAVTIFFSRIIPAVDKHLKIMVHSYLTLCIYQTQRNVDVLCVLCFIYLSIYSYKRKRFTCICLYSPL